MCRILDVPVRVSVSTKGYDATLLGKGWIIGTGDVRVAWKDGEIIAVCTDSEFSPSEEKQIKGIGGALGTLLDQAMVRMDTGAVFPLTWCDIEYVFDKENA